MELEEIMKKYSQDTRIQTDEEEILNTIYKCKEVFYQKEQEKILSYWEFLYTQFKTTNKRWWLLQFFLLTAAEIVFNISNEEYYIRRGLGITGVLFVVLVIPELWKNRTCRCMEIEASSFYFLKKIYAARILLFGIADIFLLTIFCYILHKNLYFTIMELMVQFLFPVTVTACICFGSLCSQRLISEIMSIILCLVWSIVWWLVTVNEEIYAVIVQPVWICLFIGCSLFLIIAIYKTIHNCNKCMEVDFSGIRSK
jgi:hypothetical protein